MLPIVIQICGIGAMIFCIGAFLTKNRKTILLMQVVGMGLWTVHFLLSGNYAGAAMNGLAVVRALVYVNRDKYKWANAKPVPVISAAIFIGVGLFTWYLKDYLWFLPTIAMTITSFGLFFRDEQKMRFINLFSSPPWIVYNALVPSIPAVITESLIMVSVIVALILYRKKDSLAKTNK